MTLRDDIAEQRTVDEAEKEVAELAAALDRANRSLERERKRKADVIAAVERAASDAALAQRLDPTPRPRRDRRRGKNAEVAVLVLSDWQLGKVTPSYDSDVCEERIDRLVDKVIDLVAIQRADHPVKELRVWCLGDMVEGEVIFPGQAYQVDSSTYAQMFRGGRILADLLRRLAPEFERIHTVGVIGNHGRAGRRGDTDLETNWDRVMYRHVAEVLTGRRGLDHLSFSVPEGKGESNWYHVDNIGRYGSLLFHGYNLKGHAGFPWYGLGKKVGGWALGAIPEFTMATERHLDVDFGHWHQPVRVPLNDVMARCNGSTESHNTFAQEQLAAVGRPSQGLRFVHPDKGMVTAEYTVWLDR